MIDLVPQKSPHLVEQLPLDLHSEMPLVEGWNLSLEVMD